MTLTNDDDDPIAMVSRKLAERREDYQTNVLESRPFQDALRETKRIASDFLLALNYVMLHGNAFLGSG